MIKKRKENERIRVSRGSKDNGCRAQMMMGKNMAEEEESMDIG